MQKNDLYWVCKCSSWTWASKPQCHGCGKAAPSWSQQRKAVATSENGVGDNVPRSANGENPARDAPLQSWVVLPKGRRKQRRARKEATLAADQVEPRVEEVVLCEDEKMDDTASPSVPQQLEAARKKLAEFEAIGESAREAIPGFDVLLGAAREQRDQLQRDRKASRPVQWRLVEAQRSAKAKADAVERTQKQLFSLRKEADTIQEKLAEQESELARFRVALSEADGAVAAIFGEIAAEAKPEKDAIPRASDCAVATAAGLALQVNALPAAIASSNGEAAFLAIQQQPPCCFIASGGAHRQRGRLMLKQRSQAVSVSHSAHTCGTNHEVVDAVAPAQMLTTRTRSARQKVATALDQGGSPLQKRQRLHRAGALTIWDLPHGRLATLIMWALVLLMQWSNVGSTRLARQVLA